MYQVLALKWRPRNFDELVGQEHVARTLRNSIQANRLAHAYIFAGLRGTGKTTVARIFAKCLNCEKGPTPTPCGACVPCLEITEGRALDVLEMDAASRTGVDDIRELQEVVSYAPVRDRTKVLIIDEAHMLSKQAFNALLKTLEEPPPRVIFVLATTELQKVLPTILSRCQLFEFRRVTPREVAAHLRKVCDAEGVRISDPILDRIARAGEGSVRDSLSLLERVLAFGGESVSEEDALYVLGAVRTEVLSELLRGLARRDAATMLAVLDSLVGEGHDLLHVWSEILGALRDLMLLRTVPGRADLLSRSETETSALEKAALGLSREDLVRAFQILAELEFGLKGSSQPLFLFESALIRLADLGSVRPIEEVLSGLGSSAASVAPQKKKLPEREPASNAEVTTRPVTTPSRGAPAAPADFRILLHESKPMLDAMLDRATALTFDGRVLRASYAPQLDAVRRQLERPENVAALAAAVSRAAGGPVEIQIVRDSPGEQARSPSPPDDEADLPAGPPGEVMPTQEREALLESARSEPGVAKLLLEFGAQVVDIRAAGTPRPMTQENEGAGQAEESP